MHGKTRGKDAPEDPKAKVLRREKAVKEARQVLIKETRGHPTIARGDTLHEKEGAVKDTLQAKALHGVKAVNGDTLRVKGKGDIHAKEAIKGAREDILHAKVSRGVKVEAKCGKRTGPTRAVKGDTLHARWIAEKAVSAARQEKADTRSLRSRTTVADMTAP